MNIRAELNSIAYCMIEAGVPASAVVEMRKLADVSEGVQELMAMWAVEREPGEQEATIEALYELLQDQHPGPSSQSSKWADSDDALMADLRDWKEHLRDLVQTHGGVTAVARRAEIPQPSLSRMLNSLAEPRPATLQKLADALGMSVERLHLDSDRDTPVILNLPTPGQYSQIRLVSENQGAFPARRARGHRERGRRTCERAPRLPRRAS